VLAAASAGPAAARPAERVAVIVVPASSPVFASPKAAHGLLVAGEGATVSRGGALASLLRGALGNAVVDSLTQPIFVARGAALILVMLVILIPPILYYLRSTRRATELAR